MARNSIPTEIPSLPVISSTEDSKNLNGCYGFFVLGERDVTCSLGWAAVLPPPLCNHGHALFCQSTKTNLLKVSHNPLFWNCMRFSVPILFNFSSQQHTYFLIRRLFTFLGQFIINLVKTLNKFWYLATLSLDDSFPHFDINLEILLVIMTNILSRKMGNHKQRLFQILGYRTWNSAIKVKRKTKRSEI